MANPSETEKGRDPHDLARFLDPQERSYETALAELRAGWKRSHWMWYIFPQIDGLGHSATSRHFAIKSLQEARSYLAHPELGRRLLECADALLAVRGRSASQIFGSPDDLKLRSSMTLFSRAARGSPDTFDRVLGRYFQGQPDERTLAILQRLEER